MWNYNYSFIQHTDMNDDDSLCHYGVMGMRWGVRKDSYYDKRANINARKAQSNKTTVGKLVRTNWQHTNQYTGQRKRDIKNAKGLKNKLGEIYGTRRSAKYYDQQSKMNSQASKIAKTKLGSQRYSVHSYNDKSLSNFYKDLHNTKGISKRFSKRVSAFSTLKLKRISGREVTQAQMYVESIIPGLPLVKDLKYMSNHKGEFGQNRRKKE